MVWFLLYAITGLLLSYSPLYFQIISWVILLGLTWCLYKTYYWNGILTLPIICFFALLYMTISTTQYDQEVANIALEDSTYVDVEGTIQSISLLDNTTKARLKVNRLTLDQKQYPLKYDIVAYWEGEEAYSVGDKVSIKGTLNKPKLPRNPGAFNQARYYKNNGISFSLYGKTIKLIHKSHFGVKQAMTACVQRLGGIYDQVLPERQAGIVKAMILGDRDYLNHHVKKDYREAGIAHILAISGLHVSIIGYGLYQGLKRLISIKKAALVSMIVLILYCMMTGASLSTVRAVTMLVTILFADLIGRTYDVYSSLSFAALLILAVHPFSLSDAGFLLSFAAVFSIVTVLPVIKKIIPHQSLLLDLLWVSVSVCIGTLPIIAFYYYEWNIYSLLLNILVVPLMPIVIIMSLMVGICGIFSLIVARLCAGLLHYILNFFDLCCHIAQRLPNANFILGQPSPIFIGIYYGFLSLCILYYYKREQKPIYKKIFCSTIVALAVFAMVVQFLPKPLEIIHLDVGQGDSAVILTPDQKVYLIDGGGNMHSKRETNTGQEIILPFLKSRGISQIDCMILTHSDFDHIVGLLEVLEAYTTRKLIVPATYQLSRDAYFEKMVSLARTKGTQITYMQQGQRIRENALDLYCLNPKEQSVYHNNNGHSLVYKMVFYRLDHLLTGDIENQQEMELVKCYSHRLMCDILKVPHHGSNTSSTDTLLSEVNPTCAVISVGQKNRYGHPSKEVVDRYKKYGTILYNTAEDGAVTIKSNGSSYTISTYVTKRKDTYQCKY